METSIKNHDLVLKDRKNLTLSGVNELNSFDEKGVDLITSLGYLSIRGDKIKITAFNNNTGDMEICGDFSALIYINESSKKDGFFSKLFK